MDFSEAINKLLHGKKIRRSSWGKNFWIETKGSSVVQKAYDPIGNCEIIVQRYTESDKIFSVKDTLADDWEIYN